MIIYYSILCYHLIKKADQLRSALFLLVNIFLAFLWGDLCQSSRTWFAFSFQNVVSRLHSIRVCKPCLSLYSNLRNLFYFIRPYSLHPLKHKIPRIGALFYQCPLSGGIVHSEEIDGFYITNFNNVLEQFTSSSKYFHKNGPGTLTKLPDFIKHE